MITPSRADRPQGPPPPSRAVSAEEVGSAAQHLPEAEPAQPPANRNMAELLIEEHRMLNALLRQMDQTQRSFNEHLARVLPPPPPPLPAAAPTDLLANYRQLCTFADATRAGAVRHWLSHAQAPGMSAAQLRGGMLMHAAHAGRADLVADLLEAGASVQAANASGHTPLHCAAHNGHTAVLRTLLAAGADLYAETHDGDTARMLAVRQNHLTAASLLREEEARRGTLDTAPDQDSVGSPRKRARR